MCKIPRANRNLFWPNHIYPNAAVWSKHTVLFKAIGTHTNTVITRSPNPTQISIGRILIYGNSKLPPQNQQWFKPASQGKVTQQLRDLCSQVRLRGCGGHCRFHLGGALETLVPLSALGILPSTVDTHNSLPRAFSSRPTYSFLFVG